MDFKKKFINLFSKENLLYTCIFIFCTIFIIVNRALLGFDNILWLADIATFSGVVYIILIAKHNFWGLIFNLISASILVFTGFYQQVWFNAFVSLFISIPSILMSILHWKKNENKGDNNLNVLSKKGNIITYSLYFVVSIVFMVILYFLNGNLFYLDAFYSAGCTVGLVLCTKSYINQFVVFVIADIVGLVMYFLLSIQDINNISLLIMVLVYIILNIKAYFNWKKLLNQNLENHQTE